MELTIVNQNRQTIIIPGEVDTITIERDKSLAGETIRIYDASKKYDVAHQTLSKWARYGMIRIMSHERHALELDESDVALAVGLYKLLRRHVSPQRAGHTLRHLLTA